jgi:sec-independent protein translocase protein TatA
MGVSGSEILVILLGVFLLFGSKKMPEVAKMMGKGMREFRKATDEIKREISEETKEIREDYKKINKDLQG